MAQDTAGNVAWANDNKTLFYVTKDKLDRPYKVVTKYSCRNLCQFCF